MRNTTTVSTRRGPRKALAAKLKRMRKARGWSRYRVAKEAGLAENTIRTLEGGNPERAPNPCDVSVAVAGALIELYAPELGWSDFLPLGANPGQLTSAASAS